MSYELFNLLPDSMSRAEKERVCKSVRARLLDRAHWAISTETDGQVWVVDAANIHEVCAVPPEPEKPPLHCARCGAQFGAGDAVEGCTRVACYPTCPPKQEVEGLMSILRANTSKIEPCVCGYCESERQSKAARIVEAIVSILDSRRHHEDAKQAIRDWAK